MTYAMLYQILIEAEARAADMALPVEARNRSQETVDVCKERMRIENITISQLRKLAKS